MLLTIARHVISEEYLSANSEQRNEETEAVNDELAELFYSDDEDADDQSELEQALGRMSNTVNCLLRLSATIRNPAPHDHFKARATHLIRAYEPRYKDHIKHKFVNPNEALVDRLAKSMTRRREYFRYREEHVTRLAAGMDKVEAGEDFDGAQSERRTVSTAISSLPNEFKDRGTAGATTVDDWDELDEVRSLASQATSYAATESDLDSGAPRVPEMPSEFYKEEVSKCPFCHVFVSIQTRYDWKYDTPAFLQLCHAVSPRESQTDNVSGTENTFSEISSHTTVLRMTALCPITSSKDVRNGLNICGESIGGCGSVLLGARTPSPSTALRSSMVISSQSIRKRSRLAFVDRGVYPPTCRTHPRLADLALFVQR